MFFNSLAFTENGLASTVQCLKDNLALCLGWDPAFTLEQNFYGQLGGASGTELMQQKVLQEGCGWRACVFMASAFA